MRSIVWIDEANEIDFEKLKKIIEKNKCDYDPLRDAKLIFVSQDTLEKIEKVAEDDKILMDIKECVDEEKQSVIDSFAGQVLQGMTAGFYSMDYAHGWKPNEIAVECCNIAEAMYAERMRRYE